MIAPKQKLGNSMALDLQPTVEMSTDFENDPSHIYQALEEVETAQRHTATADTEARKRTLSLTLDFLASLEQQLDPQIDSEHTPVRRAPPPPPGLDVKPNGEVDPAQISDPETRARYEQELRAIKDNLKHHSAQFELRRIDEHATERLKFFVKRCYPGSAEDRREFEELVDASALTEARKKSLRKLLKPRLWPFS
jgi:hypothetical protein